MASGKALNVFSLSKRKIMTTALGVAVRMKWDIHCLLSLPFDCNKMLHLWGMTKRNRRKGAWQSKYVFLRAQAQAQPKWELRPGGQIVQAQSSRAQGSRRGPCPDQRRLTPGKLGSQGILQ